MAPPVEYLDGPSLVMPRPEHELNHSAPDSTSESTALAVRLGDPAYAARLKDFVGHLWYGRATPA